MKKVLIFILACLLLVCCHNQRRHNMVPVIRTDTVDVFRHIFKSRTLQDSLDAFIRETEKFTGYDTLVYSVSITEWDSYCPGMQVEHPDTVLTFVMNDDFWFMHNSEYPQKNTFLGVFICGNKIIGVSSYGIRCGDEGILNDDLYDMDIWNEYYNDVNSGGNSINPFSMTCINMYSVIGKDSLVLDTKYRSMKFCKNVVEPDADTYYFKQLNRRNK